mmetsp:Transcript_32559/g.45172  ORF Transcript_32559/g.45172 Transcript_32559/m.45172 type:complete len:95 (-) Transcript_32559:187-471(-)
MSVLKTAVGNGVRELRLHFCQTSSSSAGVREFVVKNYKTMKGLNATLPILVRECSGVEAKAYARYEKGVEKNIPLSGLDENAIAAAISKLVQAK